MKTPHTHFALSIGHAWTLPEKAKITWPAVDGFFFNLLAESRVYGVRQIARGPIATINSAARARGSFVHGPIVDRVVGEMMAAYELCRHVV
jgi:hypothetical protein